MSRSTLSYRPARLARRPVAAVAVDVGRGAFAGRDYAQGEVVIHYGFVNGRDGARVERLSREQHAARYPPRGVLREGTGTHVYHPPHSQWWYDASAGGVGGMVNTHPGHQNLEWGGVGRRLHMIAKRDIVMGEELFISYGDSYRIAPPEAYDPYWCLRDAHGGYDWVFERAFGRIVHIVD